MNWDKWEVSRHWHSIDHMVWWMGKSKIIPPLEIGVKISESVAAARRVLALRDSIETEKS